MKNLKELLNELSETLTKVQSPLVTLLEEGVSKPFIKAKIQDLKLEVPEEVYTLFQWHNGLISGEAEGKYMNEISLFPLAILLQFGTAVEYYKYNAIYHPFWPPALFPLFDSGGGDYHLINCDKNSATYKGIFLHSASITFAQAEQRYDSLPSLIKTIISCFEENAYYYDIPEEMKFTSGPQLEVDYKLERRIALKHNPNTDYWKKYLER